jgi:hypothetical protein
MMMFARPWWRALVEHDVASETGLQGSGEILVGLVNTNEVTPAAATFLPEARWVKHSSFVHARTRGNPRTSLANTIGVAFLLKGVFWYATFQSARGVVGIIRRAQWLRDIFVFVHPTFSTLISLSFFFYVF